MCTYDTCQHDTDCKPSQTCACHTTTYVGPAGNACVQGDCRVDGDCGPGGYCSPSVNPMSCGSLGGYYCHTPSDQCTNDADCPKNPSMPSLPACVYIPATKRWECVSVGICA
jgi:hypothetical protein